MILMTEIFRQENLDLQCQAYALQKLAGRTNAGISYTAKKVTDQTVSQAHSKEQCLGRKNPRGRK